MFKFFKWALAAVLIQTSAAWAVEPGQALPALNLAEVQASKGQFIYIDYWASWCGPCRQSFPWMNALQAKLGAKGLKVVAVNVDAKRADADRFLAHTPAQFTIAYDPLGNSAKILDIKTMPTSILVNPSGRIIFVHSGFRSADAQKLEMEITSSIEINQ